MTYDPLVSMTAAVTFGKWFYLVRDMATSAKRDKIKIPGQLRHRHTHTHKNTHTHTHTHTHIHTHSSYLIWRQEKTPGLDKINDSDLWLKKHVPVGEVRSFNMDIKYHSARGHNGPPHTHTRTNTGTEGGSNGRANRSLPGQINNYLQDCPVYAH